MLHRFVVTENGKAKHFQVKIMFVDMQQTNGVHAAPTKAKYCRGLLLKNKTANAGLPKVEFENVDDCMSFRCELD